MVWVEFGMRKAAAWTLACFFMIGRAMAAEVVWFVSAEDKEAWAQTIAEQWMQASGNQVKWVIGNHADGARMVACGLADLAVSDRANSVTPGGVVRPSERKLTAEPFLFDAVAFLVHGSNKVSSVSSEALRTSLRSSRPEWENLGGDNFPIALYISKSPFAGERLLTQYLVWNNFWHGWPDQVKTSDASSDIGKKTIQIENSLGVASWYASRRSSARTLKLDDTELSFQSLKAGNYPLIFPLFLVYGKSALAISLSEFAQAPDHQHDFAQNEVISFHEPAAYARWKSLSDAWQSTAGAALFKAEQQVP